MAYAPTLTARVDYAPVPRIEVVFTSTHPACETATVYRVAGSRLFPVRGGVNVFASGGFALVDTEAPFGVLSTYRAEMFDAAGLSLGFTDAADLTLNATGTCLHHPLDPNRRVQVDMRPSFADSIVRPFLGELAQPLGRDVGVWVGGGRTGVTGVDLTVVTDTIAEADAFQAMFGGYGEPQIPILCVRTDPKWRLPAPFFALVRSASEERFNVRFGGETINWAMFADEVSPPAPALTAGVLTYADLEAAFPTYADFEAAYLTYLDAESDFSKAGLA